VARPVTGQACEEVVPTAEEFDVVIVGGGPGGYAAALYGAPLGLKVAVVEKDKVGGTCLHRGCVPAKDFLETAAVYRTVASSKDFGIGSSQPTIDFSVSQARKNRVVEQLWKGLQGLLRKKRAEVVTGTGRLLPGNVVQVDAAEGRRELWGSSVILAAGSVPRTIPGFEVDGRLVLTSDEVLDLTELPQSVAVIGGGAIGCEFASMLADLGVHVTLLEAMPTLLPGCDADVVGVVAKAFGRRGITIHTGVQVHGHRPRERGTTVDFGDGQSVDVDQVVVSVGRRPASEGLVDPAVGLAIDQRGYVPVDPYQRTNVPGVWAIGDLCGTAQLAHVGFAEAMVAIDDILGRSPKPVDYSRVPWCIYCHPEVAFVGLSEQAAREAGYDVVTHSGRYVGNSRALILGEPDGMVKVIAKREPNGEAGQVLGVHMVGPWVTEQLGQAYLTVNWEATAAEAAAFIQPHPTLSEAFGETMLALIGKGLHG
jgi:dihydrolipoamide dehydrogenase